MSTGTGIEWTDATWNPVVGCTPVSPGCLNCYAATMARRLEAMGRPEYVGLSVRRGENDHEAGGGRGRDVFAGVVRCLDDRLTAPLHWRKTRRVFVCSMADLFHEAVPFEFIDRVFAVMAVCPQHTFQVLTKRPERMRKYLTGSHSVGWSMKLATAARELLGRTPLSVWVDGKAEAAFNAVAEHDGVLPNVWLGASAERQQELDERVPHLAKCPAAVRFLSCEPLLGPLDIFDVDGPLSIAMAKADPHELRFPADVIDWVIVGGESGANARPCVSGWVRSIVRQCREAGTPVFVKQLGAWSVPALGSITADEAPEAGRFNFTDRKGGDPEEWPEDLRVREWPACAAVEENR